MVPRGLGVCGVVCVVALLVWSFFLIAFGPGPSIRGPNGDLTEKNRGPAAGNSNGSKSSSANLQTSPSDQSPTHEDMRSKLLDALEALRKSESANGLDVFYSSIGCKRPVTRSGHPGDADHSKLIRAFNTLVWSDPDAFLKLLELARESSERARFIAFYFCDCGTSDRFTAGEFFGGGLPARILKELEVEPSAHIRSILLQCFSAIRHVPSTGGIELDDASVDKLISALTHANNDTEASALISGLVLGLGNQKVQNYIADSALDTSQSTTRRLEFIGLLPKMPEQRKYEIILRLAEGGDSTLALRAIQQLPSYVPEAWRSQIRDLLIRSLERADNSASHPTIVARLAVLDDEVAVTRAFSTLQGLAESAKVGILKDIQFHIAFEPERAYQGTRELVRDRLWTLARDFKEAERVRYHAYAGLCALLLQRAARGGDGVVQEALALFSAASHDPSSEVRKAASEAKHELIRRYGLRLDE